MNDSVSILLATTILALGGLGLYMFKSSDDNDTDNDNEDYNEDKILNSSIFNWGSSKEDNEDSDDIEDEPEVYKPRKRAAKTHKNKKSTANSRRRY
jgi:hypothetical protein